MKTKILTVVILAALAMPANAAPNPNQKPTSFIFIDYAPPFVPRTWGDLIRWLRWH